MPCHQSCRHLLRIKSVPNYVYLRTTTHCHHWRGPAGLTLGTLLLKQNIPFTIFELRQKPTDEELAKPSGMLDLHGESGIAALKECGLYEAFVKHTGECTEADRIADKDGNRLWHDDGTLASRPEISRHNLTRILMNSIPTEKIRWGYRLSSATTSTTDGQTEVVLDFSENGSDTFDFVIGADGAWSKVRPLLTGVKPRYENRQNITLTIRDITTKYPHLADLVGPGSFSSLGNKHGVMSQRGPQDSARCYVFLTTDDENFSATVGLVGKPATAAKEILLNDEKLLGSFGAKIKELVTVACDEEAADHPGEAIDIRGMYMLPVGHSWEHKAGATVIGDAAHLICPWAGEGVNLAMWDALLLAHSITNAHKAAAESNRSVISLLDPSVEEFEREMAARVKTYAEETMKNGEMLFAEDGAQRFVKFFEKAFGVQESGKAVGGPEA